ncbi:hypothetical protein EPJ64_00935 [Brachyspira aalborgi]|jgi:4-hydroxy 2-oxovalerate aldolase|uniref:Pyruvate carboxyltransferase domain-containing protein n=1 Tax=Brachyspira aalborgi TaxID=29522 RepID=A0AB38Q2R4_9SPIR|nr:hypothetical protein EPJ77_02670 [Brachyspira aalborgi]TXJ22744.1 hypothetical protein EPJ64_00935 [Brachyspira aalborgi]TXJ28459.1 hypothetical protein EPJ73_00435 [Brachyspira aalborgi]TXJ50447.1 hypothetical protein EPJ75_02740 [Brachyspira aalborgi]
MKGRFMNNKKNIKILDCTLRDGGFINDWDFGHYAIYNIVNRLIESNIDFLEVGFLHNERDFEINRTITKHTSDFSNIIKIKNKKDAMILGMIILGEADIENVGNADKTILDGIRIVFKKHNIDKAFELANKIKDKGYKIFLQPASVTDYSNKEMEYLAKKSISLNPYAVYIVDTYGLMHKNKVLNYFNILNNNLSNDIYIGFHSHNNFQLSFANSIELVELTTNRNIILDSSLFGMGKGVGNLNTELITDYLNKYHNYDYNVGQILELINLEILKIRNTYSWGYSFNGFLAASNDCHPTYVKYLIDKNTISVNSINKILQKIDRDKKTIFYGDLIEKLYSDFLNNEIKDNKSIDYIFNKVNNRKILIIAPGGSVNNEKNKIDKFISDNNPIVVSINYYNENLKTDFIFINNAKRYNQMAEFIDSGKNEIEFILTSNITVISSKENYHLINYSDYLVEGDFEIIMHNATLMFIKLLKNMNINNLYIAGFDGFSSNSGNNYADKYLSYNTNINFEKQNRLIGEKIIQFQKYINITFLTKSYYKK